MKEIKLVNGSAADQEVDAIVNAANKMLMPGGGICGAIYEMAGYEELEEACSKYDVPLKDGDAVITPAFHIKNCSSIIHAVGPDFNRTPTAFKELYKAYYNSLEVLKKNNLHYISFPLISSGIFGGDLDNPVEESVKQCIMAYHDFVKVNSNYDISVRVCAFSEEEMEIAKNVFHKMNIDI